MKIRIYYLLVLLMFFMFSFGVYKLFINLTKNEVFEVNKRNCVKFKDLKFAGVVIKCGKNYANRGIFQFSVLSNGEILIVKNLCLKHPEAYIQKGDSIGKQKGSFSFILYKDGKRSKKIDLSCEKSFDCNYWDNFTF